MEIIDHYKKKPYLLFPLFTLLILVSVMALTLNQTGINQNNKSHADATIQNCTVSSTLLAQTQDEHTLLNIINDYRRQNNIQPMAWSAKLKQAAAWMNNDMVTNNNFTHVDSLGRDIPTRVRDCGYVFTATGENIIKGFSTPDSVFNSWKNSPPHNANMLNSTFTEVGIGSGSTYWTLDLGSSNTPPATTTPSIIPTTSVQNTPQPTGIITTTPLITTTPGISTPVPTPSGILINQKDTEVNVSIQLAGIGKDGNRSPKHLTREVSVKVFSLSNELVLTGTGFLKYDGSNLFIGTIHLGQIANGTYYIKVSVPNTLSLLVLPQFQTLSSEELNTLPVVILSQGDLTADNVIDIKDYNIALPCFQNKKCQTRDNFDLNDDGVTDVIDYNLMLSAFRKYSGN